jgi:alpha-beta hydrolase superfamily lysophospholipase
MVEFAAAPVVKMCHPLPLAALLGVAGIWGLGSLLTHATNSAVPPAPAPARAVRIESSPGITLAGSWWPAAPAAPAILMLHGNGGNRGAMAPTAAWLHTHGYAVLTIDFRGHGESSPSGKSFGLFESQDAHAALAWLRREHPGSRIGVIGFSLGGAASLLGPQGPLDVDAMVLEGVYPDIRHAIFNRLASRLGRFPATLIEPLLSWQSLPRFGVRPSAIAPIRVLGHVHVPVMVVGGGSDINTPPEETSAMAAATGGLRDLYILPGITHDDLGRTMPEVFQRGLLAFLDGTLMRDGHDHPPERPAPDQPHGGR